MTKYSQEFRLEVVRFYYSSGRSKEFVSLHFGLGKNQTARWLCSYERFGANGLKNSVCNNAYSFEFKKKVVLSVIDNGLSYGDAKVRFGMRDDSSIVKWVRQYREYGIEGLKRKPKGPQKRLKPAMNKIPPQNLSKPDSQKTHSELVSEVEYLRAELDFRKKWNALMKEKARQGKVRLK
ncbi:MAG: transposase [Caulobacterales bacterium]|nr:transposase [Caulobacterales bacterium]